MTWFPSDHWLFLSSRQSGTIEPWLRVFVTPLVCCLSVSASVVINMTKLPVSQLSNYFWHSENARLCFLNMNKNFGLRSSAVTSSHQHSVVIQILTNLSVSLETPEISQNEALSRSSTRTCGADGWADVLEHVWTLRVDNMQGLEAGQTFRRWKYKHVAALCVNMSIKTELNFLINKYFVHLFSKRFKLENAPS